MTATPETTRDRLARLLPGALTISRYGDQHLRVYGMIHTPDAAALADLLEQAKADRAAVEDIAAVLAEWPLGAHNIALLIDRISRALNPSEA